MKLLTPWGNARPSLTSSVLVWGIRARLLRGGVRRIARRVMSDTDPYCDIEVDGIKMRCHLGDNWTETLLFEKGVKGRSTGLERLLNTLEPGFVVVDIGANCGAFTLFAANAVGTTGRIISIEPMPAMLDRLRFNAQANGFTNITIFETAVGPVTGTAELHVRGGNHGESTLVPNGSADRVLQVPVATLADLMAASGVHQLDALKIDIEGSRTSRCCPMSQRCLKSCGRSTYLSKSRIHTGGKQIVSTRCLRLDTRNHGMMGVTAY